jgi:pimeloyl-ACP methyl ester carboxylesterase
MRRSAVAWASSAGPGGPSYRSRRRSYRLRRDARAVGHDTIAHGASHPVATATTEPSKRWRRWYGREGAGLVDEFATLSRGRMHFVAAGAGTCIVLLHGWPGLWFDYRHVLSRAGSIGRCIAPDFFGFGSSDAPNGDPVDAADEAAFASDIVELLDTVGVDDAVIVGHDIGSAVGPAVARLVPDRVQGLVLLNATHPRIGDKRYMPDVVREAWYQQFHLLPLSERLIDGDRRCVELYLGYFYEHWAGRDRITPEELDFVIDNYARPGCVRVEHLVVPGSSGISRPVGASNAHRNPNDRALGRPRSDATARSPQGVRGGFSALGESGAPRCRTFRPCGGSRRSRSGNRRAPVGGWHPFLDPAAVGPYQLPLAFDRTLRRRPARSDSALMAWREASSAPRALACRPPAERALPRRARHHGPARYRPRGRIHDGAKRRRSESTFRHGFHPTRQASYIPSLSVRRLGPYSVWRTPTATATVATVVSECVSIVKPSSAMINPATGAPAAAASAMATSPMPSTCARLAGRPDDAAGPLWLQALDGLGNDRVGAGPGGQP